MPYTKDLQGQNQEKNKTLLHTCHTLNTNYSNVPSPVGATEHCTARQPHIKSASSCSTTLMYKQIVRVTHLNVDTILYCHLN